MPENKADMNYLIERNSFLEARNILDNAKKIVKGSPDERAVYEMSEYSGMVPTEGEIAVDRAVEVSRSGKVKYKRNPVKSDEVGVVVETPTRNEKFDRMAWFYKKAEDREGNDGYKMTYTPLREYDRITDPNVEGEELKVFINDFEWGYQFRSSTVAREVSQSSDLERDLILPTFLNLENRVGIVYRTKPEEESNIVVPGNNSNEDLHLPDSAEKANRVRKGRESLKYTAGFSTLIGARGKGTLTSVEDKLYFTTYNHVTGEIEESKEIISSKVDRITERLPFGVKEEDIEEKAGEIAESVDLSDLEDSLRSNKQLEDWERIDVVLENIEKAREWN
ncbi:MAG: hypothetical protein SVV03_06685 [Candidatus Nanohaloarchaea archaeon]|nr:hypothetical protein [Candidatus Nanohaloarchaea archaeon]